jgi:hypothetical protein
MDVIPLNQTREDRVVETQGTIDTTQLEIGGEEEGHGGRCGG